MKAVIIAGGRGKRLALLTDKIPKPMITVGDFPVLEHQIRLLKKYQIKDIIILTAYLSQAIENYFKNRKDLGVNIACFSSRQNLGNADRVKLIESRLKEDFFVFYGDLMLDMNLKRMLDFHLKKRGEATLVLHPNNHPQDSDLVEIDRDSKITAFHLKPHPVRKHFRNLVNAGLYILSPRILKYVNVKKAKENDFCHDVFPKAFLKEKIFGYVTPEYIKDIGTMERLNEARKDYQAGKIKNFNLENKRKAIFIDRDGVINKSKGYIFKPDDFELFRGTAEAIKKINNSDFLVIVATNQPVVARGLCNIAQLEEIHKKMETLLGREGAKLDAVYYCPHHPDRSPAGNKKYRVVCKCRKPKTGMIKQAEKDFNIDLRNSYMIGDFDWDISAGKKAGLITVAVETGSAFLSSAIKPDYSFDNLEKAVNFILKQ